MTPTTTIRRLLVANRGEIARRVFATCRDLGIETVAVHSDADATAPHVREADLAVRLAGNTPAETYLRVDSLVDAALRSGADAVHPGYGFLAEDANFATAVIDAGLIWVGPPPGAIAAMGSKVEAKALMRRSGVPTLPSWTDPTQVTDFPVLIKASAGGGGRGMRIVHSPAELPDAWATGQREAAAAFGDGTVFCERYVEHGRHIEVQVFADTHGTIVALGERECSIQRRHQKIIEESPSPAVNQPLRAELFAAAVSAARAVNYVGAGTVEFFLAPDGQVSFLEMNTRLQVEHPVTEYVTGLDLVRLQILVAEGRPLPFTEPPPSTGHAIEVRLYAEDSASNYRPSTGILHRFAVPGARTNGQRRPDAEADVRLDSGVIDGSTVSVHYDPLLAKVISWAADRDTAARRLADTLVRAEIHGVVTNRDLLTRVLRTPGFLHGHTDTAFLDRHPEVFAPLLAEKAEIHYACLAAALARTAAARAGSVWAALPTGWRNVASAPSGIAFATPAGPVEVTYQFDRRGDLIQWSAAGESPGDVSIVSATATEVVLALDGVTRTFRVNSIRDSSYVDSVAGSIALTELPRFPLPLVERAQGSLIAPMPGAVGRVSVRVGQPVNAGDLLLTLEAMKLEHPVHAPEAGVISKLLVESGDQVEAGAVLAVITATIAESEDVA